MTTPSSTDDLDPASTFDPGVLRRLFRLFLNREVEDDAVIDAFQAVDTSRHLSIILGSEEFEANVLAPLDGGRRPWLGQGSGPDSRLVEWAADALPLTAGGVAALREATETWSGVYHALLSDERLIATLPEPPAITPARMARLAEGSTVIGGVERADTGSVRGWVADRERPNEVLSVELWLDDAFASSVPARTYRRQAEAAIGGDGRSGFAFEIGGLAWRNARRILAQVRLAGSGLVLGEVWLDRPDAQLDVLAALRRDVEDMRRRLAALDNRLPVLEHGIAASLSDYSAYADAWRTQAPARQSVEKTLLAVLVDARKGSSSALQDTLHAVLEGSSSARVVVVSFDESEALASDLCRRLAPDGRARVVTVGPPGASNSDFAEVVRRLKDELQPDLPGAVMMMDAGVTPAPGALSKMAAVLAPGVHAVYADADAFEPVDMDAPSHLRRRIDPVLRPAFDPDLMRQTPFTGPDVMFCGSALDTLASAVEAAGDDFIAAAVLELARRDGPASVAHLPIVATSRPVRFGPDRPTWAACVAAALDCSGAGVEVGPHDDILGVRAPGAVRVRHRPPPEATATVIVPTRDRPDLLGPCVDSLTARRGDNATAMDLVVVDHTSARPDARAQLDRLAADGLARVVPFEGPFNWALMNNLAAADSTADVLVFLNDDTVVLSPDWLDELTAQALRPDVGVVGCRLLYQDGTIQHAGFVARERDWAFLTHEGVGVPGSDGGYLGRHALMHATTAVTGACMAVARETFEALGGFDAAAFPVEGNDVDLCLRAWSRGLKVLYDPYATLYHLESKTRGEGRDPGRRRVAEAASRLLWARWGEGFGRDPWYNPRFDRLSAPFTRLRPPDGRW